MSLGVIEKNGKFVVTKDGQPIRQVESDDCHAKVTEFTSKSDAERYLSILKSLLKKKK